MEMRIVEAFILGEMLYLLYYWEAMTHILIKTAMINRSTFTDSYFIIRATLFGILFAGLYMLFAY